VNSITTCDAWIALNLISRFVSYRGWRANPHSACCHRRIRGESTSFRAGCTAGCTDRKTAAASRQVNCEIEDFYAAVPAESFVWARCSVVRLCHRCNVASRWNSATKTEIRSGNAKNQRIESRAHNNDCANCLHAIHRYSRYKLGKLLDLPDISQLSHGNLNKYEKSSKLINNYRLKK